MFTYLLKVVLKSNLLFFLPGCILCIKAKNSPLLLLPTLSLNAYLTPVTVPALSQLQHCSSLFLVSQKTLRAPVAVSQTSVRWEWGCGLLALCVYGCTQPMHTDGSLAPGLLRRHLQEGRAESGGRGLPKRR